MTHSRPKLPPLITAHGMQGYDNDDISACLGADFDK
jgi:hypothetical protein